MITFICDGCRSQLQISNESAGKLGCCPYCHVNTRVPGNPKRTSKLTILARIGCLPFAVVLFWAGMFLYRRCRCGPRPGTRRRNCICCYHTFFMGGYEFFYISFWTKRIPFMEKGRGRSIFDTLDPPLNTDPPEVRFKNYFVRRHGRTGKRVLGHYQPRLFLLIR